MLLSGLTAVVSDLLRRKPGIRVWFNTAQYMLAIAIGTLAYRAFGGGVSLEHLAIKPLAFVALVLTFIIANTGSVALAVALSTGVSIRESWARIIGSAWLYDFLASGLAVLLAFLYLELQFAGLILLVVPMFLVRHTRQMYLQLERANRELLELMVKAIEARDPYTSGHSVRVAEYAKTMAREIGLPAKQVDQIATAALLHDVGKIYEEFAPLLRKEGRLTPEERMLMQGHPVRSAELVGIIAELRGAVEVAIRNHHENYDGTGYPDGLAGDRIPIGARIIMIADTLDAMTTDRPYRKALTLQRALEELRHYSGRQFDPKLVEWVWKSPSIRRLLGPQLATGETLPPSMQGSGRASRVGARAAH
jgi:putative nucleotidyltransferase with HDIG domain